VRYAPIVTCQRMVGRIPGGGGLEGPWAAFVGAVESGLLATVLTRTHAGPLWPRRGSHACQRRAGQRPLSDPVRGDLRHRSVFGYLALDTPVSSALTHQLTACSRSGRLIEDLEKVATSIPGHMMGGWRRQVPMS
jgi:hypothetical protein